MTPCSLAMKLLFRSCKSTSVCMMTWTHWATQMSRKPHLIRWRALFKSTRDHESLQWKLVFFYYVAERNEREVRLRAVMNELVQLKCGRNVTWASSHRLWKAVSLCRQKVCIRKALYKQAMSRLCGEKLHWFILWFGLRWNFNAFFMLSFQ